MREVPWSAISHYQKEPYLCRAFVQETCPKIDRSLRSKCKERFFCVCVYLLCVCLRLMCVCVCDLVCVCGWSFACMACICRLPKWSGLFCKNGLTQIGLFLKGDLAIQGAYRSLLPHTYMCMCVWEREGKTLCVHVSKCVCLCVHIRTDFADACTNAHTHRVRGKKREWR